MNMVPMDLDYPSSSSSSGGDGSASSSSRSSSTRLPSSSPPPLATTLFPDINEFNWWGLGLTVGELSGASGPVPPATTSSPISDTLDFFDFDRYERDGKMSGMSSGSSSGNTPALTEDSTTTPPSDHHSDSSLLAEGEEDHHSLGAASFDRTFDALLYPTISDNNPEREPHIVINGAGSPSSTSAVLANPSSPSQVLPAKRSRSQTNSSSGSSKAKKQRNVQNPEKTAEVRDSGACIRCRIKRTGCDVSQCAHCKKLAPKYFAEVCIRDHLPSIGPVFVHIADKPEDPSRRDFTRTNFTGRAVRVSVYFGSPSETDDNRASPMLRLPIQEYRSSTNGKTRQGPNCAIPREEIPSWDDLMHWAGQQIHREASEPFLRNLAAFFVGYVVRLDGGDMQLPRLKLLKNVWTFATMFKIWRTHPGRAPLHCRGSSKGPVRLPPSVQEELRHVAKKAMESLERDILAELETCMTQGPGALRAEERPLLWACLWQLLWCYRGLLTELVDVGNMIEKRGGNASLCTRIQECRKVTSRLYMALISLYSGYFDKPKFLHMKLDLMHERGASIQIKGELEALFGTLLEHRVEFYKGLKKSTHEVDAVLKSVIVESELKRLAKGAKKRKAEAAKGVVAASVNDDDDDDEDDE